MEQPPNQRRKVTDMEYADWLIKQVESGMQYDLPIRSAIEALPKVTDPAAKQKLHDFIAKYTPGLK